MRTCKGCDALVQEDAGRGCVFFICTLGKFDRAGRPVIEHARIEQDRPGVPAPAWCKKGNGYILKDGNMVPARKQEERRTA